MSRIPDYRAWVKEIYENDEFAYGGYMIEAENIKTIRTSGVTKLMTGPQKVGIEYLDPYGAYMIGMGTIEYLSMEEIELMEYTGLKDKNGTKIYEGDVLELHRSGYPNRPRFSVEFIDGSYYLKSSHLEYVSDYITEFDIRYAEVVGNVHESVFKNNE